MHLDLVLSIPVGGADSGKTRPVICPGTGGDNRTPAASQAARGRALLRCRDAHPKCGDDTPECAESEYVTDDCFRHLGVGVGDDPNGDDLR
jgi:hypothetical protein